MGINQENINKPLRYRWYIFWLLAMGYILVYFHRQCTAVLAVDMMKDLNTDGTIMGLLGALYFYPYALMQLPAGLLSDSWGPRKTITFFFLIAVLGSAVLGYAHYVPLALMGRLMVGIGVAMLFVPTLKVLAEWFKTDEFATMMGILMAMGGIGSMTSAAPLAYLSNLTGWRNSFLIVSGFTLLLSILVWLIVRDRPEDMGWQPVIDEKQTDMEKINLRDGLRTVVREPKFWILGTWFFFTLAIFFSFGGLWGGPYLMQVYGFTRTETGNILSMLALGMITGSPLLSFISNRILKSRKKVIIVCSVINVGISGLLAFYTSGLSIIALYILCFSMGAFTSAVVVIAFTSNKELFPVQIAGTSTGLINLFPFAGGAVFQQVLGSILEVHRAGSGFSLAGYRQAFTVLFICSCIALAASLFVKETFQRAQNQKAVFKKEV